MLPTAPPKKHLIFLDAETYYDRDYSLRKMPTPNYILDPRFELQMLAVKVDDKPHEIIDGPDVPAFLAAHDPAVTTTVTFNSLFDNSLLAWRYGWVPHTMLDAMGMARAMLGHQLTNFSLRHVAEHLGLGAKGTALNQMMGKRRDQIIAEGLWPAFCQYALQDNYLCEQIFLRLFPDFPWAERRIMDLVIRCCVEPRFRVDTTMLEQHLIDVRAEKAQLLCDAGNIDVKTIMSTPKFKAALEARGIEVAMKVSPTTGKETPAFAKTDEFMEQLQEHSDPVVAAMACARLGHKSTLEETRTEKLLSIATLPWVTPDVQATARRAIALEFDPALTEGHFPPPTIPLMPVPLRYGGAHTHRLSGEWKMNMQNMPSSRNKKSKLRASLIAGPDETIVTCDLSQIEARIVAWICGCTRLVDEFANNKDPYSLLGADIFGIPGMNRKAKDAAGKLLYEIEGFIGKTGILGLGYGCGKDNFDTMVTRTARSMKLDISQKYTRLIGDKAVDTYRTRYSEIPRAWLILNQIIQNAWLSGGSQVKFGPVIISYGNVLLPSGLSLRYADPRMVVNDEGRHEFRYRYGKFWHRLYGAKLLENIVQALARIVVMNAALRIRDRGRSTYPMFANAFRFALQAHDELVFIVPKIIVDDAKNLIHGEMIRRPSWGLDIPIDAEVGQGASYGEAK